MQTLFVTGATGQIGRGVVEVVAQRNRIIALARGKKIGVENFPIEYIEGNITRPAEFLSKLNGVDGLIHMAALTRSNNRDALQRINVQGTLDLVHAAHEQGVRKIIVVSSASVTADWLSPYAQSKKKMEEEIRKLNFPVTIVRPTLVYSQNSPALQRIQNMATSMIPFIPLPYGGSAQIQPIHARDVGASLAFLSAQKSTPSVTFDLGCAEPFSLRQIFETVLQMNKKSKPIVAFPPTPLIQFGKRWVDSIVPAPYSILAMLSAGEGYRINPGPFLKTSRLSFTHPEEGIRKCLNPNSFPHPN